MIKLLFVDSAPSNRKEIKLRKQYWLLIILYYLEDRKHCA